MNKKLKIMLIISIALLLVSSMVASAADTRVRLTATLNKLGKFLFEDLPKMGDYGFKFLLWIILFTLMHYGLKKAGLDNKIASVLALALSLGTVIIINGKMIEYIFRMYGTLVVLAFGVLVPILLLWVVHRAIPGGTRWGRFIRAAAYIVIGYALITFSSYSGNMLVS